MFKKLMPLLLILVGISRCYAETITIDIPDDRKDSFYQDYAVLNNWQPTVPDPLNTGSTIPNPVTIKQNAINQIVELIVIPIKNYKLKVFQKTASDEARAKILAEKQRLDIESKLPDAKVQVIAPAPALTIKKK